MQHPSKTPPGAVAYARAAMTSAIGRLRRSAEWRFLGVLGRAGRGLTAAWWGLVVVRALLPAAFAIAMGALVGAVQGGRSIEGPLAAAGLVFVALNAAGPGHEAIGASL